MRPWTVTYFVGFYNGVCPIKSQTIFWTDKVLTTFPVKNEKKNVYLKISKNYLNQAGSFITWDKWDLNQGINIFI